MSTTHPLPGLVAGLRAAPTGLRLLVALSLALLPLGALALFAATDSYRFIRINQTAAVRATLELIGGRLGNLFAQEALVLRAAEPINLDDPGADDCSSALARLDQVDPAIRGIAVYRNNGQLLCKSSARQPARLAVDRIADTAAGVIQMRVAASGDIEMLTRTSDARSWIVAHIPAQVLKNIVEQSRAYRSGELLLEIGNGRLMLSPPAGTPGVGGSPQSLSQPVFQDNIRLTLRYPRAMVRPGELLSAMLPFLMWIAAIAITWIVVNGLLLRPLGTMRRAVEAYTAGNRSIRLLPLDPPGLEAARLAAAFDGMADAAAVHESEIELSMDRQRELTREVHHRVKNNLQVVASLLSVQSRSAATPEVAAAYASIQQRVDALALVHRHHYAEAEISRGIDLRTLLGELVNALQANFFTMAGQPLALTLKSGPLRGLQDTALPMAFLLTEVTATLADQLGDAPAKLDVTLEQLSSDRATLTFASPSFVGNDIFSIQSGRHHARIVQGLARQLRGVLHHDAQHGVYHLEIATVSNPA